MRNLFENVGVAAIVVFVWLTIYFGWVHKYDEDEDPYWNLYDPWADEDDD